MQTQPAFLPPAITINLSSIIKGELPNPKKILLDSNSETRSFSHKSCPLLVLSARSIPSGEIDAIAVLLTAGVERGPSPLEKSSL